jgi:hypothetical protein
MNDFSILFDTIPEYNDIKYLVDFLVATNDLLKKLDNLFTMKTIFGNNLNQTFESNLSSRLYIETSVLLNSKLSLTRVFIFLFKSHIYNHILIIIIILIYKDFTIFA